MRKQWKQWDFIFFGSKITADGDCSHEIKKHLLLGRKCMIKPRQCIKKQRHHFADKGPYNQNYSFSSSHLWMWEVNHKEGWELRNWWLRAVVLEKTHESPLDSKEIKPVHPKRNQSWIVIGSTDDEADTSWITVKYLDNGEDWRLDEKRKKRMR